MADLWQRLKQRKLVQWAVAYIAGAFALLQGIDIVAQQFGWPEAVQRGITLALVLGFFVTLLLAWYHGERGEQKVSGTEVLLLALLLAVGGGLMWQFGKAVKPAPTVVAARASSSAVAGTPKATPTAIPSPATSIAQKSVAVLPFNNDSGDPHQQYFSDGLSQDLITALTQFKGLKVISRDSAFQFRHSTLDPRAIARQLGVAHLLEGSVQKQGEEVRISVTLVNAADGSSLWSQRYDKPYKDLFALQDAITQAVASALQAKLLTAAGAVVQSERPPSGSLKAWQAYQQGRFYDARSTLADGRKAIDAYGRATRIDPRYAAAYARMSGVWTSLAAAFLTGAEKQQAYARARTTMETALRLAPDSALAHVEHGYLLQAADLDWQSARAAFRRAAQLDPDNPAVLGSLARMDATLGHVASALTLARKALAGNPLAARGHLLLGRYLASLGRLDAARRAIAKGIELQPASNIFHAGLAMIEILRGKPSAALQAARQEPDPTWRRAALALANQPGPDRKAADAALQSLIEEDHDSMAYQIAEVYALRRDPDAMFGWLDRAWAQRDPGIGFVLYDPFILRYRDDPRFAAFCKKVGLPATTDAVAMP